MNLPNHSELSERRLQARRLPASGFFSLTRPVVTVHCHTGG